MGTDKDVWERWKGVGADEVRGRMVDALWSGAPAPRAPGRPLPQTLARVGVSVSPAAPPTADRECHSAHSSPASQARTDRGREAGSGRPSA